MSRSYPIQAIQIVDRSHYRARRLLLILIDALLLPLAVWFSFWLRLAHPFHPSFQTVGLWLLPLVLLIGLPFYAISGQYKGLTRYVGSASFYRLAGRNGLLVLLLSAIGVLGGFPMPPWTSTPTCWRASLAEARGSAMRCWTPTLAASRWDFRRPSR